MAILYTVKFPVGVSIARGVGHVLARDSPPTRPGSNPGKVEICMKLPPPVRRCTVWHLGMTKVILRGEVQM